MAGLDDVVDQACEDICASFGEAGLDAMMGMCGNAGQEAIIGNAAGDYMDAAMDCQEGDAAEFSTDHDEAVGEIVDVGNQFLEAAAEACAELRAAAESFDMTDLGDFM